MNGLKQKWAALTGAGKPELTDGGGGVDQDLEYGPKQRLVVAHFMLGNTYPFTEADWTTTFNQAEYTGLDALALNLGFNDWQLSQALSAFQILASRPVPASGRKLQLFMSMDMDALPSNTEQDAQALLDKMLGSLAQDEGYLRWRGRKVLSTFSGHEAKFGGWGWKGWLERLNEKLSEKVFFWPSFFLPPLNLLHDPIPDGIFSWNSAWPLGPPSLGSTNLTISDPLLFPITASFDSSPSGREKAYMTSVSPVFYTHYAKPGESGDEPGGSEWEWSKNWLFASDHLLYPSRWQRLIDLPREKGPDVVQVVSWNDYGESHYITPTITGGQPGSWGWTEGMGHAAFQEMTRYFIGRWRDGKGETEMLDDEAKEEEEAGGVQQGGEVEGKAWMWYRPHPAQIEAKADPRGRPANIDWAEDLINVVLLLPAAAIEQNEEEEGAAAVVEQLEAVVLNGKEEHLVPVYRGEANMFTVPFVPGRVTLQIRAKGAGEVLWEIKGRDVDGETEKWNYNFWSGNWDVQL